MTSPTDARTPAAARERGRSGARPPDFFIVGHHKSGTTALYEMLRRHPQIFMPDLKEPRFLASDLVPLMGAAPGRFPETLEQYLALFADAREDQIAGEASPSYLRSRVAARAIAELQPAARCIAILREPASFVRSLHFQLLEEHVEREKDLRKAVAAEQITRAGRPVRRYSDHIHYAEQLKRFHEALPREQTMVLIYDDFRADNEGTLGSVLRFLQVDDSAPIAPTEANPTVSVRNVRLDGAIRALYSGQNPLSRAAKGLARTVLSERSRKRVVRARRRVAFTAPAPPDEQLMRELRSRYKPEVLALSEYLGRDLVAQWGYDDVD
jgi:Sulfotransferase domain